MRRVPSGRQEKPAEEGPPRRGRAQKQHTSNPTFAGSSSSANSEYGSRVFPFSKLLQWLKCGTLGRGETMNVS